MQPHQDQIFQWLADYAYQPNMVYLMVFLIMIASGFGFPVPEEVTIVSVGLLAYMGAHPEIYPAPFAGAPVVNGVEAAFVTLTAVMAADILVFFIGRVFGRKIIALPRMAPLFSESRLERINGWVKKYGSYAVFFFRFTPGIRFPAHVILGMSKLHLWQFVLVDGLAASISVPTQILLIYHFGEPILQLIHKFRDFILVGLAVLVVAFVVRHLFNRQKKSN